MLRYEGASDAGRVRPNNEAQILMDPGLGLFVVADGMGGHRHGHLAAELACTTLKHYIESSRNPTDVTWPFGYNWKLNLGENRLITGILLANRHVWKRSDEDPGYAGMGSTIVAVLVQSKRAALANVGDSRAYLFRNHHLSQLSVDDTWLNTVLNQGTLGQKTLLKHPMRNVRHRQPEPIVIWTFTHAKSSCRTATSCSCVVMACMVWLWRSVLE